MTRLPRLARLARLALVLLLAACAAPLTVAEERDGGGSGPSFSPAVPGDSGLDATGDAESLGDPTDADAPDGG